MGELAYKEALFYVMSGTGNTYRVSRWIEEIVNRHKVKSKMVMVGFAVFHYIGSSCILCLGVAARNIKFLSGDQWLLDC